MRHLFCLLAMLLFSVSLYAGSLRVILPSEADLSGYEVQEGELAYGSEGILVGKKDTGSISADLYSPNLREVLPNTYKATNAIMIGPGIVYFGHNMAAKNTDPIACLYDYAGEGGHDGVSPNASAQIMYLYLIYNVNGGPNNKINCIMSTSYFGPQSIPSYVPWRRLYSFWTASSFTSIGQKVYYSTGSDMLFVTTSPSACTKIQLNKISNWTERARIKINCATAGSTNYNVYTDSTCSAPSLVASCSTAATLPSFIEVSPTQSIYYKGVVGANQIINLLEINEPTMMSLGY